MAGYNPKPKPPEVVLNSTSELNKLLKALKKEESSIIEFLASVYKNEDNDVQVRLKAATTLLDKRVQVAESVGKEQMAKILLASKLQQASLLSSPQQNNQPRAIIDFSSIQKLEGVDYEELDKEDNSFDMRSVGGV